MSIIYNNMNFYNILDLEPTCTHKEIRQAYKKLVIKYHPDKPYGNEEKFKQIKIAYDVLSDEEKRMKYDLMNEASWMKLYDVLNSMMPSEYVNKANNVVHFFNIKNDINDMNFTNIKSKIFQKLASPEIIDILKTVMQPIDINNN